MKGQYFMNTDAERAMYLVEIDDHPSHSKALGYNEVDVLEK